MQSCSLLERLSTNRRRPRKQVLNKCLFCACGGTALLLNISLIKSFYIMIGLKHLPWDKIDKDVSIPLFEGIIWSENLTRKLQYQFIYLNDTTGIYCACEECLSCVRGLTLSLWRYWHQCIPSVMVANAKGVKIMENRQVHMPWSIIYYVCFLSMYLEGFEQSENI